VGSFAVRVRAGWTGVRIPARIAGRMRVGRHVVEARIGTAVARRVLTVRPPDVRLRTAKVVRSGVRPVIRIRSARAARGRVEVRRGARTVGTFGVRARKGWTGVRVPARVALRMRRGAHRVELRLDGAVARATVRVRAAR
jgi:hypothetical protein